MRRSILHVITGLENGGAESALLRLITADTGNAHQVISLTTAATYGRALEAIGVEVHALGMPRGRVTLRGLWQLGRQMARCGPDLVQTWMYHADVIGGLVAKLVLRAPVVWSIRASDLGTQSGGTALRLVLWLSARLSSWLPARIICNSRAGARVHLEYGYAASRIVVVENGYDHDRLAPCSEGRERLRDSWGAVPAVPVLGMVARWDRVKDHATLVAALSLLQALVPGDWMCALVGTGMSRDNEELATLLERHGVSGRVKLLGPRTDIRDVMNALDLHVLSSRSEGLPNVLAEAMSCGTPCVTTDVGDASELVGPTGWVVPASDPAALADALKTAMEEMSDAPRWQQRQARCRRRIVDRYGIGRMVASFNEVWATALYERFGPVASVETRR